MNDNHRGIRNHVRAANMILEQAEHHELALPFNVSATENGLKFQFWTCDQITQWATWGESVVQRSQGVGVLEASSTVELFDQRISLVAIEVHACGRCGHRGGQVHSLRLENPFSITGCTYRDTKGFPCSCPGFVAPRIAVSA